jgi:hypothetical protein
VEFEHRLHAGGNRGAGMENRWHGVYLKDLTIASAVLKPEWIAPSMDALQL